MLTVKIEIINGIPTMVSNTMPTPREALEQFLSATKDYYTYADNGTIIDTIVSPKVFQLVLPTTEESRIIKFKNAMVVQLSRDKKKVLAYNENVERWNKTHPHDIKPLILLPYFRMSFESIKIQQSDTVITLRKQIDNLAHNNAKQVNQLTHIMHLYGEG